MTETSFDIPALGQAVERVPKLFLAIAREIEASMIAICAKHNLPLERARLAADEIIRVLLRPNVVNFKPTALPHTAPELFVERRVISQKGRKEDIIEFLRRVWKPWMEEKLLTRASLRKLDHSADKAVENWLRLHPYLPSDIYLPSFPKRPRQRFTSDKINNDSTSLG